MCVVSMITDHYRDNWWPNNPWQGQNQPYVPETKPQEIDWGKIKEQMEKAKDKLKPPTQEEIAEFRKLLERAREYDKRNNEPNCELDIKKQVLKELAKLWGIDISFIDKE